MLAKVATCALAGLEVMVVQAEVYISNGLPSLTVVGLPDAAVQEARERVRAAIKSSGYFFPPRRVTVNLAPADVRKAGPGYDLPIAVGVLAATAQVPPPAANVLFVGELSLDGSLRHSDGILPVAAAARDQGFAAIAVPAEDAAEAALVSGIQVIGAPSLTALVEHMQGRQALPPVAWSSPPEDGPSYATDFAEIKGQEHVKRALEVAAAGGHNVIMSGPPGAGKTLLARSLPSILPALSFDEALEVTKLYSIAGQLPRDQPLIRQRPFRAPHHTISYAALVGGGRFPRPGEVSLAHHGVLFLDELPEFSPQSIEMLRQPLEDRGLLLSRVHGSVRYPARLMLVAAMNPCPCGHANDAQRACTCSSTAVTRYQKRISGAVLDRIDIQVDVPRVDVDKLTDDRLGEPSASIRQRVEAARAVQRLRFEPSGLSCNADMLPSHVRQTCGLDAAGRGLMRAAMQRLGLSARAYHRVLKLARTVADLAGAPEIQPVHLAEAIQYRRGSIACG